MYAFLIVVHIIVSIFLIIVILLQAGRGGGLADTFGGSQLQSLFGSRSTSVLTKLTSVCAGVFIITCLSLAIISSQRSKSLIEKVNIPETVQIPKADTVADVEIPAPSQPAEEPKDETQPQSTATE